MSEDIKENEGMEFVRKINKAQSNEKYQRLQNLNDRRAVFVPGGQWEEEQDSGGDINRFKYKPQYEDNKMIRSTVKIFNEYRNNPINIQFKSRKGNDKLADDLTSLFRADEQDFNAEQAYSLSFDDAAAGGIGGWRVIDVMEDEYDDENEDMRIKFSQAPDSDTCMFFDPNSLEQDKSDAKWGTVLTKKTFDAYEDEYDESPSSFQKLIDKSDFDWTGDDHIYVAEHYEVEDKKETCYYFEFPDGSKDKFYQTELDEEEDYEGVPISLRDRIEISGAKEVNQRKIKKRRIYKYLLNGIGIIPGQERIEIAGDKIPLIFNVGKRLVVDGIERCNGHVRYVKELQRLYNSLISKLGEIAFMSSARIPIVTKEMIAGHADVWGDVHEKNYPYVTVNSSRDAEGNIIATGPMNYLEPPTIPPALQGLITMIDKDIKELQGMDMETEGISPATSGVALEIIGQRLDQDSFLYIDNHAKARVWSAKVWLSKAEPHYYKSKRDMIGVDETGKPSEVKTFDSLLDGKSFKAAGIYVTHTMGPGSSSKRNSVANNIAKIMPAVKDPQAINILTNMLLMNMDGEGLEEGRAFFRKQLINQEVIKPTDEEKMEMDEAAAAAGEPEPSPEDKYFISESGLSDAKAAGEMADIEKTKAEARYKHAQTEEIKSEIGGANIPPIEETPAPQPPAMPVDPGMQGNQPPFSPAENLGGL